MVPVRIDHLGPHPDRRQVINELPPMDRDIAMVFQNYALYPHMSVYDNMAFGLKMRKFDKPDIARRVRSGRDPRHSGTPPAQAAAAVGRQRQRVALGRAIVRHPQVFFCSTSHCRTSTPNCVSRCGSSSESCTTLGTTGNLCDHDQVGR